MSWDETVGLMLSVALLSGVIGAALAAGFVRRREAREADRARAVEAYARWLAARLTLSRASLSFVAAFRALAAERRESTYFPLRTEEAQRARALWCETSRDLDLAEATLMTMISDSGFQAQMAASERVSAEVLRTAINGAPATFDGLVQQLRAADQRAVEFARAAAASSRRGGSAWREWLGLLTKPIQSVVDRWRRG
ncbi:MAG: hypothetical protein V1790_18895 [Planctomycetota bacterium]